MLLRMMQGLVRAGVGAGAASGTARMSAALAVGVDGVAAVDEVGEPAVGMIAVVVVGSVVGAEARIVGTAVAVASLADLRVRASSHRLSVVVAWPGYKLLRGGAGCLLADAWTARLALTPAGRAQPGRGLHWCLRLGPGRVSGPAWQPNQRRRSRGWTSRVTAARAGVRARRPLTALGRAMCVVAPSQRVLLAWEQRPPQQARAHQSWR